MSCAMLVDGVLFRVPAGCSTRFACSQIVVLPNPSSLCVHVGERLVVTGSLPVTLSCSGTVTVAVRQVCGDVVSTQAAAAQAAAEPTTADECEGLAPSPAWPSACSEQSFVTTSCVCANGTACFRQAAASFSTMMRCLQHAKRSVVWSDVSRSS